MPKDLNRRAVFAWCLYDFANSAFITLVVTFIYSTYFTRSIAGDVITGTALWSRGVTISSIVVALLSPFLGALADRSGHRKRFLLGSTVICVLATAMLYFPLPGETGEALFWFIVANIAFGLAFVFYNAYLPDIAPRDKIGRISGYGWSLGFVGGLLAMFIAMVALINPETPWLGFTKEGDAHIRATNVLVAAWFGVFSIPLFIWVRDKPVKRRGNTLNLMWSGVRELSSTFHEIRRYREIMKFLLARLIYNDGLITVFAFAGIYSAGTFDFSMKEIMVLGVGLNIAAGIGAFALGYLDDRLGGKNTVLISLAGLILAAAIAVCATSKWGLWIGGMIAGVFAGPNQSASRSLMGRFVPRGK
ncbi:MFS transporter, partial [bacterium]|nr:MFS transporter [bacterium]